MAYLTLSAARAAASATAALAHKSLSESKTAPLTQRFDVFLSHCIRDAQAIEGVRNLLVRAGVSVYVDWIDDPLMDRGSVSVKTAATLRTRMQHCESLYFATSNTSPSSKWMPWELGYFDGRRPGYVAILPLVETAGTAFRGQEYLALYPTWQDVGAGVPRLGMPLRGGRTLTAKEFVREGAVRTA